MSAHRAAARLGGAAMLLQLGASGRAVWAVYALLPLLLLPAGVAVHAVLRKNAPLAAQLGLDLYLGNYLGEFIGELALNLLFLVTAIGAGKEPSFPRWSVPAGVLAAAFGLVGLWRNVTPAVAMIAEIENTILPLWLAVLGVLLVRAGGRSHHA